MDIRVAPDASAVAALVADTIARRLRAAVVRRGTATVAFSGGSTPRPMLERLATMTLPWEHIEVFQVDERVAPDGDPARNIGLLHVLPVRSKHLHAMPVTATDLRAAARRYGASLPPQFDVIHLGLGDDGHTASWPPGDPVIDSTKPVDLCDPYQGLVRMTLTPPVVNAARARIVHAVGASKAAPVGGWLLHDASLPIERVRRAGTVVVLDTAAAARLPTAG